MMPNLKAVCVGVLAVVSSQAMAGEYMKVTTSQGVIISQLYGHASAAPVTVQRLRDIVSNGEWDADKNAFFHRSVSNFVIQGGAFGIDEAGGASKYDLNNTWSNIQNEAGDFDNDVRSNIYGTMAMARFATDDTPSASNQFFYNLSDNSFLNYESNPAQVGFTVFGFVVNGVENAVSITGNQTKNFKEKQFAPEFADLDKRFFENIENRNAYKKHFRDNFTRNSEEKYFETVGWYNDFPSDTVTRFYYGEDPMADDSFDFSSVTEPNSFFWDVEVDLVNSALTDTPMSLTYDGNDASLAASDFVTFSVEIYTTIDGDTDGDGDVDLGDLMNVRNNFGGHNLGDANGDSLVNQLDLDMVLANFGGVTPVVAIPEPTTLGMLLIAGAAIVKRRKNK